MNTLLIDIGGVLKTDGWDLRPRQAAAERFGLDFTEMESRHRVAFDSYERGHLTLDQYLDLVVFHAPRSFSRKDFESFMFSQPKPFPETIDYFADLKTRHGLRVVVVSNEGRELAEYSTQKFPMDELVDAYVFSGMVGLRKPDPAIFKLALDLVSADPSRTIYVDNTPVHVEMARSLGMFAVQHTDLATTRRALGEPTVLAQPGA
jgi:putative hydrolase of the HAD superfamily